MTTNKLDWLRQDWETGQWFRVLVRGGGDYNHQVEIPLLPEVYVSELWKVVGDVLVIREDVRFRKTKDKSLWTHRLPFDVINRMQQALGAEKTDLLINGDIYSLIDWAKFSQLGNKKCPLDQCRREFTWHYEQIAFQNGALASARSDEVSFKHNHGITLPDYTLMIGGIFAESAKSQFLIYGYYHIPTGYVGFNLQTFINEQEQTSTYSRRLKRHWQKDLVLLINKLSQSREIETEIEPAILKMVEAANLNLMTFNFNSL